MWMLLFYFQWMLQNMAWVLHCSIPLQTPLTLAVFTSNKWPTALTLSNWAILRSNWKRNSCHHSCFSQSWSTLFKIFKMPISLSPTSPREHDAHTPAFQFPNWVQQGFLASHCRCPFSHSFTHRMTKAGPWQVSLLCRVWVQQSWPLYLPWCYPPGHQNCSLYSTDPEQTSFRSLSDTGWPNDKSAGSTILVCLSYTHHARCSALQAWPHHPLLSSWRLVTQIPGSSLWLWGLSLSPS